MVSPAVQARLLRALEAKTVRPVGSDDERAVDVRVVAATPVDLSTRVAQGHFRADLYYRLSVVSVEVPALRARREDLGIITAELLRRRGFSPGPITGPNFDRLRVHSWPGNVRELRNVLERALALSVGATDFASLRIALMPDGAAGPALSVRSDHPWKEAKDSLLLAFEEKYLRDVHERFDGNLSAGARFAQVDRKHWRELLQKHGLVTKGDPSPE